MPTTHARTNRFRLTPRAERHARSIGVTAAQAVEAIASATANDQDARGSHYFDAEIAGIPVRVVLAPADSYLIDAIERR
jgi:hypothetical protein